MKFSGPPSVVPFRVVAFIGFSLLLVSVWAIANGNAFPASETGMTEIEGTIRLVGSEPFTRIVITTAQGRDYYLEDDSARERFANRIGERVRIRGVTGYRESGLAGTDRVVREYHVREIKLVE